MEPIDNVSKAMEILRQQMTENLARLRRSGQLPPRATPAARRSSPRQSLRETVARRIRSIDAQSADFDSVAVRVFIESVLTAEFGDDLVNDPQFRDMLREVEHAMLSREPVRQQLQAMVHKLRAA